MSASILSTRVITLVLALCCFLTKISSFNTDSILPEDIDPCETCRILIQSFEKGMYETSRGKHEGGDTSWEEKNLKSYTDSEVRLTEIQEKLCEDAKSGKNQCLSLAEETESEVEEWWFKQRQKNVKLFDYLCISKLKYCCPDGRYGPTCQPCPSMCNHHGTCDGSGSRQGTGECQCVLGYTGDECDKCEDDYFRIATSDHFTCRKCDLACLGCYGPGRNNCTECRNGYYKHEIDGCIDVNECEIGIDSVGNTKLCKGNSYCINTDGSFKCADCHVACSGCVGYGSDMCISCARGYQQDDDYVCRTEDELEDFKSWKQDATRNVKGSSIARFFFYVGIISASFAMLRSNLFVLYTFLIGFITALAMSEFYIFDDVQDYSEVSST